MSNIHPTAIIAPGAQLAEDVIIGPFCTVGENVSIGTGTRLVSHVVVDGHTTIGTNNTIYPFASLGLPSPDLKYKGEPCTLTVGDDNTIRESVTIHIGTMADKGTTTVGSRNLFMPGTHIAHDCVIGNNCILANYVQLAGHVHLADNVIMGGLSGVLQRVRIGKNAIIGGHTAVDHDVPPYANVSGRRGRLKGLNLVGLRRGGVERALIQALDDAYTTLFDETDADTTLQQRAQSLKTSTDREEIRDLTDFVLTSQRGLISFEDE